MTLIGKDVVKKAGGGPRDRTRPPPIRSPGAHAALVSGGAEQNNRSKPLRALRVQHAGEPQTQGVGRGRRARGACIRYGAGSFLERRRRAPDIISLDWTGGIVGGKWVRKRHVNRPRWTPSPGTERKHGVDSKAERKGARSAGRSGRTGARVGPGVARSSRPSSVYSWRAR